jgi:hypothetical protein
VIGIFVASIFRVLQERDSWNSMVMPMWQSISDRMNEFKALLKNADIEAL